MGIRGGVKTASWCDRLLCDQAHETWHALSDLIETAITT